MSTQTAAAATLAALVGACAADDAESPSEQTHMVPVVDHALWTAADAAQDPLADHRPATVDCSPASAAPEGDDFEVDTGACNYYAGTQPALVDIGLARRVDISLRHFDLASPDATTAHVAVLFDDLVVWEEHVDIDAGAIGAPAQVFEVSFESPVEALAGTPVHLHLHNHGQNNWALRSIEAEVVVD